MADIILEHEALKGGKLRYRHLLGRKFELGKEDCYQIAVDMFKDNLGIELSPYARPNDFWLADNNLYVDNYRKEGFQLIDDLKPEDLRPFDAFLIALPDERNPRKLVTNHCAIYLGEGQVIHHRMGTLSTVAPYRGALRNLTTHVIRHKDVADMRPKLKSNVDIMEYILPHKREALMGALNEHNKSKD